MKRSCLILVLVLMLTLVSSGQQSEQQPEHTHNWEPANCTRGELCWSCGETRGEALGHNWVNATCDRARHCTLCGREEGDLLPHTSDGSGSCAVCKAQLNVDVILNAKSPNTGFVVYGGAVLRFPFYREEGNSAGVFGKEYWIYDQENALVAHGVWDQRPCDDVWVNGGWVSRSCHDTDYISLSPGTYRVEYDCYTEWRIEREGIHRGEGFRVPSGLLVHGTNTLTVYG